jgi:FtsH-binding integral membrane protein
VGSGATNPGGVLNITFTGSAAFTSSTSFWCVATYQSNAAGTASPAVAASSGTAVTIKADSSKTLNFICVGN